jgi:hypothetical protein
MTDGARYNDVQYRKDAEEIGEPLAATASPDSTGGSRAGPR